jgi:hypothetical protein
MLLVFPGKANDGFRPKFGTWVQPDRAQFLVIGTGPLFFRICPKLVVFRGAEIFC